MTPARHRHSRLCCAALALVLVACGAAPTGETKDQGPRTNGAPTAPGPQTAGNAPPSSPASPPPSREAAVPPSPVAPIPGAPELLRPNIALRKVAETGGGSVRLTRDPRDGTFYLLSPGRGVQRVNANTGAVQLVIPVEQIGGTPAGMAFGPDGTLFLVTNAPVNGNQTQATILRGTPADTTWTLVTLAQTAPYPLSDTPFDHLFNGIAVSADGQTIYVNSGSRTDHGEVQDNNGAFPNTREVPLTSAIFRLPATATNLALPNDAAALDAAGVVYARGTRNAYSLAFAPTGELFAAENGPDADYPDEINLIIAGNHYGHPWRYSAEDNPQRRPDYDSAQDKRLSNDFTAVKTGTYQNDPSFPPPPGPFTDPLLNRGPAATQERDATGKLRDAAAEGRTLAGVTPHRSPLGLVFGTAALPSDVRPADGELSAFVVSWGAAGGSFTDRGQDLLHLRLTRDGTSYAFAAVQIARGFKNPIDAVLVENRLYVLDYSPPGALWELTFTPRP